MSGLLGALVGMVATIWIYFRFLAEPIEKYVFPRIHGCWKHGFGCGCKK